MPSSSPSPRIRWPHLQRFLDEGLTLPRGAALEIDTYAGIPLTFGQATSMRQAVSKLRTARRNSARDGICPYDSLAISARLNLKNIKINVTFPYGGKAPSKEHLEKGLDKVFYPCAIKCEDKTTGAEWSIGTESHPAPAFHEAWREIRTHLPGHIIITNDYQLVEGKDFKIIGGDEEEEGNNTSNIF